MPAGSATDKPAILVGTDFSASAGNAVVRAIAIARANRAALHVLHASARLPRALVRTFLGGGEEPTERARLDRILSQARAAGVGAHAHYVERSPSSALRAKARELSAALIVVGARGRTLPDALMGSTAERISAFARVPVLLVRRPSNRPYRAVLIAVDVDSDVGGAVAAAALVAPQAHVAAVHAYEGPYETALLLHGANAASIQAYRRQTRREAHAALSPRIAEAGTSMRAILDHASDAAPHAAIVVRTHSMLEYATLARRGVWRAFVGEIELGRAMARASLRGLDVASADAIANELAE